MTSTRAALCGLAVAVAATCGPGKRGGDSAPARPAAPPAALDRARLDRASMLTRGRGIDDAEWARWSDGQSAAAIVDELVADRFLAEQAAPAILLKHNLLRQPIILLPHSYTLSEGKTAAGERLFWLGAKPCKASNVISVRPWWDLSRAVHVCRDAVGPAQWTTQARDGTTVSCGAAIASKRSPQSVPGKGCACGPNLLRCAPEELYDVYMRAAMREASDTVAHAVAADLPLASLFEGRATVRTREVELLYLKSIAEGKQMEDPEPLLAQANDWPGAGKLVPRAEAEPGQHAGLLTSPLFIYSSFDPRQRMRIIYETMWCADASAPGALPEHLFSLPSANLSMANEGWKELAARPICTRCHARLDYGRQFFAGYPSPTTGAWHFVPRARPGEGPLYGHDIGDERGRGALTAAGFTALAIGQPEFPRCMARDVAEYVFGPDATAEQVDRLIALAPATQQRFRPLIRAALLELVTGGETEADASAGAGLDTLLGNHCTACHFDGADLPSLEGRLDPWLRVRLLDQVLSGRMPPASELPLRTRTAFVAASIAAAEGDRYGWTRTQATLRMIADVPPALPMVVARQYVRAAAGAADSPRPPLNLLENALDGKDNVFTPNYAAVTALETYRTCVQTSPDPAACATRILDGLWSVR